MRPVSILTEAELRRCVTLDLEAVAIVEPAFAALAGGEVIMPPILSMAIPERHGEVDVKTAYVPGLDGFAIKVSLGFFDNLRLGLPSLSGLMVLLDAATGFVKAVLLDNGYLTDIRTAAAGAVAARHLAPEKVTVAGVIGAGVQAGLQLQALQLVRDFEEVRVWARDPSKAQAFAKRMRGKLDRPVQAVASVEAVVREAQAVVTTTPATSPLVRAAWLHPGLHITAMGSDAAQKGELEPAVLARADRLVCDRRSQSATLGEMRAAIAAGVIQAEAADELGEVIAGTKPERRTADEITVCDLTGTGIQDTAIATHAFATASARGFGKIIES